MFEKYVLFLIQFKRRLAPIRDHFERPDTIQSRELVKIGLSYELINDFSSAIRLL